MCGVVYRNVGGYPTMYDHGTIVIWSVLVETGRVEAREPETEIALDTPAGLLQANVRDGQAQSATIQNVASFLYQVANGHSRPGHRWAASDIVLDDHDHIAGRVWTNHLAVRF
jgi:proline racemase